MVLLFFCAFEAVLGRFKALYTKGWGFIRMGMKMALKRLVGDILN